MSARFVIEHSIKVSDYTRDTDGGVARLKELFGPLSNQSDLARVMHKFNKAAQLGVLGLTVLTETDQEQGKRGVVAWQLKSVKLDYFDLEVCT